MEKEKQTNFFIIERIDSKEKSDSLYNLSILDNMKEKKQDKRNKVKQYFNNIIKAENSKKISLEKKVQILKVVKKAVLSSNLTNKSSLILFIKIISFVKIFRFILKIALKIYYNKENSILNQSINEKNSTFNNTNNYNNSINIANNDNNFSFIFNNSIIDFIKNNIKIQFAQNIKQMIIISFLLFYIYIFIPKWDKISDTVHKITSYLLHCESTENNNYFYYLMEDFSILVTKKKYYYENKNLLQILSPKNEYLPDNNIILYCINIINNYISEKSINTKNQKLILDADYNDINVLTLYIEMKFKEKIKLYLKQIIAPLIISIIINIIIYNPENELFLYFLTFILLIVCQLIFIEYIKNIELNIDEFIGIYNYFLIKKNRFIYKKNRLIMYFALKNNNYTKEQIINFIERIINS